MAVCFIVIGDKKARKGRNQVWKNLASVNSSIGAKNLRSEPPDSTDAGKKGLKYG